MTLLKVILTMSYESDTGKRITFYFEIHGFACFYINYEKTKTAILNQLRTTEIT